MPSKNSSQSFAELIASWRGGSAGFTQFLADVEPRVPSNTGGFTPFKLEGQPKAEITAMLDNSAIDVGVLCWPRRHGKTVSTAMILVWRFLTRPGEAIAVVANSEKQVQSTAFKIIRQTFEQTPFLKRLVAAGTVKVQADRIELSATGSWLQAFSSNPSALWGMKLSAAQISEIHAAKHGGDDVFEALAGSLLDTTGSLLLIDSTVAPKSSKLYELYQAATHGTAPDRSIYFSHIQHRDLDAACKACPPWIKPDKLRSLSRQMLPTKFALLHLNRWGDAANLLFPPSVLDPCIERYPIDLDAIRGGAAYIVGGGLDRAFGGTVRGDKTVTACVAKVALDDEEHIYVLDAASVMFSRMGTIKGRFEGYHKRFDMTRLGLESYGSQDVADWAATRPYSQGAEVVHPSRRTKYQAFLALYQAAAERRLHIDPKFTELIAELRAFEVNEDGRATDGEASIPKFSHPRGGHDDYVHAVVWALYSLRTVTLNAYEIEGIHCMGRGPAVPLCALNGGAHIPACADTCRSMGEAKRLHGAYLSRGPLVPVELEIFIIDKLQNTGAHTLPK